MTELVIKPQSDPNSLWPFVLGGELGQSVTATIAGIEHKMVDGEWVTVWRVAGLSSLDRSQDAGDPL